MRVYIDDFTIDERFHLVKNSDIPERSVCFSPLDLTKAILVLGKMGSGKTAFLSNILIQDWAYNRAVVHDLKGEYVERFYREGDIIFNVYDERSYLWDVWGDVKRNPALIKNIAASIATAISKEEDFWISAAAKLLSDAMLYALQTGKGWNGVLDVIANARVKAEEVQDKTMLSVLATVQVVEDVFELMAYLETEGKAKKFSIYDFLEKADKQKLFLLNTPAYQKSLSPLFSAFLSALIQVLLSRPDTKEDLTMLMLDEFLSLKLSKEDATALFTAVRSKGGQLIVGSQYLPADSKDGWKLQLMLSSRYALFLFKVADQKTIEILGKLIGTREWIFQNITTTMSVAHTTTKGPIYMSPTPLSVPIRDTSKSVTMGTSVSSSAQRQKDEFLSPALISTIPEYHHISFVESFIYLGYTPYTELPKRNESFVQRDMTEFWERKTKAVTAAFELEEKEEKRKLKEINI